MAVEITVTSANFTGTGASATYAPGFYVNSSDQVKVYVNNVLKTIGDDYTVNNVGVSTGCTVVANFPLGSAVYIERQTPITQLVDTQNNETILEDVLDAAFDKLTLIAQELGGGLSRALVVPKGETGYTLEPAASRASFLFGFDDQGNADLPFSYAQVSRAISALNSIQQGQKTAIFLADLVSDVPGKLNGTVDATADLITALTMAVATGVNRVSLAGGVFLAGQVSLPSGVALVGDGGTLKAAVGYYQILIPDGSVGSTVDGIIFDAANLITAGSPTGETACISSASTVGTMSKLNIRNNTFKNIPTGLGRRIHAVQLNYGEAIVVGNVTDQCGGDIYNFNSGYFIVAGNIAKNGGDGGIAFNNNARGVVLANYIYKCDLGIGAGPEGTTASPEHTLIVAGNEIRACGDGINMGWFGYVGRHGPRNVKVVGNTVDSCKRAGIRYDGAASTWTGFITIVANSVSKGGVADFDGATGTGFGISVGDCKYAQIALNSLHDNAGTDIYVNSEDNIIALNTVDAGAYADAGGNAFDVNANYTQILANTVFGRRALVQNSASARISLNKFVLGLGGADQAGLVLAASAVRADVDQNTFLNCANGIHLANVAGWLSNRIGPNNDFIGCTVNIVNAPMQGEGASISEIVATGTVNASGFFDISHGTGNNGGYIASASAWYKGGSGESLPMTLGYADGGNLRFTGGVSGRACRALIRINRSAPTW